MIVIPTQAKSSLFKYKGVKSTTNKYIYTFKCKYKKSREIKAIRVTSQSEGIDRQKATFNAYRNGKSYVVKARFRNVKKATFIFTFKDGTTTKTTIKRKSKGAKDIKVKSKGANSVTFKVKNVMKKSYMWAMVSIDGGRFIKHDLWPNMNGNTLLVLPLQKGHKYTVYLQGVENKVRSAQLKFKY